MTTTKVSNTTKGALGLPKGPVIPGGATVLVNDWEKKQSTVVKAWLDAGALVEGDLPTSKSKVKAEQRQSSAPAGEGGGNEPNRGNGAPTTFTPKTDEEKGKMTNAELAAYIEGDLGGEVKSGSTKDDLLKQVGELEAKKVAG